MGGKSASIILDSEERPNTRAIVIRVSTKARHRMAPNMYVTLIRGRDDDGRCGCLRGDDVVDDEESILLYSCQLRRCLYGEKLAFFQRRGRENVCKNGHLEALESRREMEGERL